MKSPLIISVSALALLTLSATLFAQTTTGSSLISQMKAATHAFTLSGDLNSGATDLESSPLTGKKTGDMLSAGEYNRLLELVGQGGGVATECSGFQAYRNYTTISSLPPSDIINFTTEHFDKLGEFNPVTGVFTAKSDGLYIFTAEANPQAGFDFSSQVGLRIFKKNPPTYVIASNEHNVGGSVTVMSVARLYAGDQVFSSSNVGNGTFPVLHRFAGVRVDCGGGSSGGGGDTYVFLPVHVAILDTGLTKVDKGTTQLDLSTKTTVPPNAKAALITTYCVNYTTQSESTTLFVGNTNGCSQNSASSVADVDINQVVVPLNADKKSIPYNYTVPKTENGGHIRMHVTGFIVGS